MGGMVRCRRNNGTRTSDDEEKLILFLAVEQAKCTARTFLDDECPSLLLSPRHGRHTALLAGVVVLGRRREQAAGVGGREGPLIGKKEATRKDKKEWITTMFFCHCSLLRCGFSWAGGARTLAEAARLVVVVEVP